MWRKIIDDYKLKYLNDLFENKLIFLRSKISSDQKRFFIALSLYPLSFFAITPFRDPS